MAEAFLERRPRRRPAGRRHLRQAHEALLSYPWPGNVRELRNALERATILCDGGSDHARAPADQRGTPERKRRAAAAGQGGSFPPGGIQLDAVERDLIAKALREAENNRSRAARLLGITRSQLYSRLQKYGLAAG